MSKLRKAGEESDDSTDIGTGLLEAMERDISKLREPVEDSENGGEKSELEEEDAKPIVEGTHTHSAQCTPSVEHELVFTPGCMHYTQVLGNKTQAGQTRQSKAAVGNHYYGKECLDIRIPKAAAHEAVGNPLLSLVQ